MFVLHRWGTYSFVQRQLPDGTLGRTPGFTTLTRRNAANTGSCAVAATPKSISINSATHFGNS
jgi:hypothetical protein